MLINEKLLPPDRAEWLEMRKKDITSTDVSALFGESKYATPYELACIKMGDIEDPFKDNERSQWGQALELAIATRVAERFGVDVIKKVEYMRIPSVRAGASFDFEIIGLAPELDGVQWESPILRSMFNKYGPGLLEIKNVDWLIFKNEWQIGLEPEAPSHIEIQLQHQLFVSSRAWGCIAALEGGNKLHTIIRMADPEVHLAITNRVVKFWRDLDQGVYPPISYPDDNWILKQIYKHAEPGSLLDARGDKIPEGMAELLKAYAKESRAEKRAKDRKETAHVNLLRLIGEHERVVTDSCVISCNLVAGGTVSYVREPYRYWRITPRTPSAKKKPKKKAAKKSAKK
jgi:hypothetical protein